MKYTKPHFTCSRLSIICVYIFIHVFMHVCIYVYITYIYIYYIYMYMAGVEQHIIPDSRRHRCSKIVLQSGLEVHVKRSEITGQHHCCRARSRAGGIWV